MGPYLAYCLSSGRVWVTIALRSNAIVSLWDLFLWHCNDLFRGGSGDQPVSGLYCAWVKNQLNASVLR